MKQHAGIDVQAGSGEGGWLDVRCIPRGGASVPQSRLPVRDRATSGVVISLVVGVVYAVGSLIQLDLAARSCPPETAGTTFALLMSLTNLSAALSQRVGGSSIYEAMVQRWGYASAFQVLVSVEALFTPGCWLLIPLLSRALQSPPTRELVR
jgi:hypothetical protein